MSQLRLPYYDLSASIMQGFLQAGAALSKSTLGRKLIEIIYLRISQINGCAYCLAMHSKELRELGETDARLDTLAAWRLSPHFTDSERAALLWAESVTDVARSHAPDDVYDALKKYFDPVQISDLTFAIALMNAWNRVAVGMQQ